MSIRQISKRGSSITDNNLNLPFNNVFICYSRTDEILAMNIYHRLRAESFQIFLDQINIQPGVNWEPETLSALLNANFIVVVLTEESAKRNNYAMQEIKKALELYHNDANARRMIFPVRIGEAELPEGLKRFQWTNYSVNGLDKMVKSFRKQQENWGIEIETPVSAVYPIQSFRESWPWISLILTLIVLLSIRLTMKQ
jgi:hypothetical protein